MDRLRRASLVQRRGAALAATGLLVTVVASWFALARPPGTHGFGVSRTVGDPGIAIHWVLCPGEPARTVGIEGHVGGSATSAGAPILWQIRSDEPPATHARLQTFSVGETPAGFYETVPLAERLPTDLIGLNGPPGDWTSLDGMSFTLADLPRDAIVRGDYEVVTPKRFEAVALATCTDLGPGTILGALGVVMLGVGGAVLAGRARPTLVLVGFTIAFIGLTSGVRSVVGDAWTIPVLGPGAERQARAAFVPGGGVIPTDRPVMRELSESDARPELGGVVVARITSPGPFSYLVECDGLSIQMGELSEIPNGSTGGRQLIGCATSGAVRGILADRIDRSDLVELVVIPNGTTTWRIVVVDGPGNVGPFTDR